MASKCNLGGMNDAIAPNGYLLDPSPIWNTLIPSRPELPYDIHDSDDNDDDDEDDDLSPVPIESEEADYTC